MSRVDLLDGEGETDDVHVVDGGVSHVNDDGVAVELILLIPKHWVGIHTERGVDGVELHGVADALNVDAEEAHAVVGLHLPRGGVDGDHLEGVGVHVERVALRILHTAGAVGG